VRAVAKGRVWSGADAKARGLVDSLGGFWVAAKLAAGLGKVPEDAMVFKIYPAPTGILRGLRRILGGMDAGLGVLRRVESLLNLPAVQALEGGISDLPGVQGRAPIEMRATHLPRP
jgi:protease-4